MSEDHNKPNADSTMSTMARLWLRLLLVLSLLLFIAGIFSPMITLTQLVFIHSTFSIVSGILQMYLNGQFLLLIVVGAFSILLPLMKIFVLFKLLSNHCAQTECSKRYLYLMHQYGRWSMLDVMVVAVMIVTVKLGVIASIQVHYGLYLFGASVLMIMWITHLVVRYSAQE